MNDSGYGSFEDANGVLARAGTYAQRRHNRKEAAVFEIVDSGRSTPATPISPPDSRYGPVSTHSRDPSYGSITGEDRSAASSPEGDVDVDSGSPTALRASPIPTSSLPTPYLPLRKESLNRLQLHIDTDAQDGYFNDDQTSPTPFSRDSRISNSPPRLRKDRQPSLPTSEPPGTPGTPITVKDDELFLPPAAPALRSRMRGFTSTTSNGPPQLPQLKPSASIPDLAALRKNFINSTYRPDRGPTARDTNSSLRSRDVPTPWNQDEVRASFRSAMTNGSHMNDEMRASVRSAFTNGSYLTYASSYVDASETERSSVLTRASSICDSLSKSRQGHYEDEGMSVDDAIEMYVAGFTDDLEQRLDNGIEDIATYMPSPVPEEARATPLSPEISNDDGPKFDRFFNHPDLPKSPPLPDLSTSPTLPDPLRSSPPEPMSPYSPAKDVPFEVQSLLGKAPEDRTPPKTPPRSPTRPPPSPPRPQLEMVAPIPRDRYGFKKQTQQVTVAQYDVWNRGYTDYLNRRREKWHKLMRQHGLPTENPERFPPKTDKVKRYIRKGIPPEWRGAAWFWYAGGPQRLISESGTYWELIEQAERGYLNDTDREHIERDLNRTFPDNIKFKPEVGEWVNGSMPGRDIRPQRSSGVFETPVLRALRRVLQAFAIHNPNIGYCQSLNFLAGLLLLFLDEDEEKAFILLNIVTNKHLPGTHAKVLEANVDIGVLMSCIRESMPAIWAKIDDHSDNPPGVGLSTMRLPTVSLATTSWFMSLFIGSLPIESVLRVWDCFFYEGSKTLFRIALAIFKAGEQEIRTISDPMEIFQVVQQIPRRMIDVNSLMEACYKRRNGFGHLSQDTVEKRRDERRKALKRERARANGEALGYEKEEFPGREEPRQNGLKRAASKARLRRAVSRRRPPPSREG
jgi:TBC1 domain family member 6